MNLIFSRLQGEGAVAAGQFGLLAGRQGGDLPVEDVVLVDGDDAQAPAGGAVVLGEEYTRAVLWGTAAAREAKPGSTGQIDRHIGGPVIMQDPR